MLAIRCLKKFPPKEFPRGMSVFVLKSHEAPMLNCQRSFAAATVIPNTPTDAVALWNELQEKTSKRLPLSRSDLRHLLVASSTISNGYSLARDAVSLFQNKGYDFTEEICVHFIRISIQFDDIVSTAKILADPAQRMGAWLCPSSMNMLVDSLIAKQEVSLLLDIMLSTIDRGLKILSAEAIEKVTNAAKEAANAEELSSNIARLSSGLVTLVK